MTQTVITPPLTQNAARESLTFFSEVEPLPYASTTVRDRIRAQLRARDGDGPCQLQLTEDCRAVAGEINYAAKAPHPRSFTADHIVPSEQGGDDSLENSQQACWECNRRKSDGRSVASSARFFRTHRLAL